MNLLVKLLRIYGQMAKQTSGMIGEALKQQTIIGIQKDQKMTDSQRTMKVVNMRWSAMLTIMTAKTAI